jgi:hypothetical protein
MTRMFFRSRANASILNPAGTRSCAIRASSAGTFAGFQTLSSIVTEVPSPCWAGAGGAANVANNIVADIVAATVVAILGMAGLLTAGCAHEAPAAGTVL